MLPISWTSAIPAFQICPSKRKACRIAGPDGAISPSPEIREEYQNRTNIDLLTSVAVTDFITHYVS